METGKSLRDEREFQAKFFSDHTLPDGSLSLNAEQVSEARKRNDAITELAKAHETQIDLENMASSNDAEVKRMGQRDQRLTRPVTDGPAIPGDTAPTTAKSLGELFVESPALLNFLKAGRPGGAPFSESLEVDLGRVYGKRAWAQGIKALFDTATGYATQPIRLPDPLLMNFEGQSVASLMPEGRTSQNAIPYMEETTATNAAVEVGQGLAKPEAELALEEKTSPVRKIATHLPVTDEAFDDIPFLESYIDTRLRTFVQLRENSQLLTGDGAGVNLRGLLNVVGIQTQALGADSIPDAIYKAITKIRVNAFLEATGAVFHPNDWQDVRLMRADGATGLYLWGSPSEAGPERIWGLDVVVTTSETENTALVGAFRTAAQVFRRTDISLQVGWINDQFTKNQRTILAEERLALVAFRPTALCAVTGI
jgi:HK97 family phage major capsid protein